MICEPILIAAPKRSGTTMLAWLLHLHGVWIGEAGVTKDPTTNPQVGTENTELKKYLKTVRGVPSDFRAQIMRRMETDGPWLVKAAAILRSREAWLTHFPDAKWLLPKREPEGIVQSQLRHPGTQKRGERHIRERVERSLKQQDEIARRAEYALPLHMDAMCAGDEDEARFAVEWCGLDFDPAIYHAWVDPERWHMEKADGY